MKSATSGMLRRVVPLKVDRRFGGTCRLQLNGRRISQARHQRKAKYLFRLVFGFLFLRPLSWRRHVLSETADDFQRTTWHYNLEDINLEYLLLIVFVEFSE
jgi:hypothetical protein